MCPNQTIQNGKPTNKAAPQIEWQDCDNDSEWQARTVPLSTDIPDPRAAQHHHRLMGHWQLVVIALAILITMGSWTYFQATKGIATIEAELNDSTQADLWIIPRGTPKSDGPFAIADVDALRPLTSSVQLLSLNGNVAIIRLTMQPGPDEPALRQTRLYQRTPSGWRRINPTVALWGSPRQRQTRYFDFHYYAQDEEAVEAVATLIDSLYEGLTINFQPAVRSPAIKQAMMAIEVDPSQEYGSIAMRPNPDAPLVVASPATYLSPVTVTEGQLLAQSIILSLLKESQVQAIQDNDVPEHWQWLVADLHLWQLWQLGVPLAEWRSPLLSWILTDIEEQKPEFYAHVPAFSTQFCAFHQLWMPSPLAIQIPLSCDNQRWADESPIAGLSTGKFPLTLAQLTPINVQQLSMVPAPLPSAFPGSDLVVTTLFDYAAAAYGKERLLLLVQSLHAHDNWQTLTPAVFGVSASEFENGWRQDLVKRYHISCHLAGLKCKR